MNINYQDYIRIQCSNLWSILNIGAQKNLPQGFKDFLSGKDAEKQNQLRNADSRIGYLFKRVGNRQVGDCYRRDLSGVNTENQLAEYLCEITLVATLSKLSSEVPVIHPKNNRSKKGCDVKVNIVNIDVYGDAKRLEDKWLTEPIRKNKRSIAKSPVGLKPVDSSRPRSMDLYSKLKDVHRQFPQGTVNIIFLFHPSLSESISYIRQALFGEGTFFQNEDVILLENDGLFAIEEWRKISGCAYTMIDQNGTLSMKQLWQNPRAATQIPKEVNEKLKELS